MSIFSRKSKSSHAQTGNAKQNGRPYPGSQQAKGANGQTVDPIVQRMAMQAASRRRMNGETPDYSISSASSPSSIRHPSNRPSSIPSASEQQNGRLIQGDGLTKSTSASADPDAARVTAAYPQKQMREPNKIRKSSAPSTPRSVQAPFMNGSADPDMQKVRMPWQQRGLPGGLPSPQVSGDSGYASIAASATMDSRTLRDLETSQEPELLRRHRQINSSLSPREEEPQARTRSMPASQFRAPERITGDLPATPRSADNRERRDSNTYVSRLDPGPVSSGFLSQAVAPQIAKTNQSETSSMTATPRAVNGIESPAAATSASNTAAATPRDSPRRRSVDSRKSDSLNKATTDTIISREPQPITPKSDQVPRLSTYRIHRLDSRPSQVKPEDAVKAVLQSEGGQPPVTRAVDGKLDNTSAAKEALSSRNNTMSRGIDLEKSPVDQSQVKTKQPVSTSSTPFATPRETPANSSDESSNPARAEMTQTQIGNPDSSKAVQLPPLEILDQKHVITADEDKSVAMAATTERSLSAENGAAQPSAQMRFPSPKPQTEFPYLDGIAKGATTAPVSVLEGYKVNRRGQILDEEGDVIGELVQGEVVHCVRRKVNAQGDVVDDNGTIVGHARPLRPTAASPKPYDTENVVSPVTPHDNRATVLSKRQIAAEEAKKAAEDAKRAAQRPINASDSEGNVVYIELDTSNEVQAGPVIDHSEIFIPPFGDEKYKNKSRSFTNLPETGKKTKRRKSSQVHTPSASQERMILDGKQDSRKWGARYSEAMVGDNTLTRASTTGQAPRPRSFSTVTNKAPKAVLGPTWEALLDTVPDPKQAGASRASIPNGAIVDMAPQPSVPGQAVEKGEPASTSSSPEKNVNGVGMMAGRRTSQTGGATSKGSLHRPFANSPLNSVAHTPPGTGAGPPDSSFHQQLAAPAMGGMKTSSTSNLAKQAPDEEDDAAPAPIIMKRATAYSTKSGYKRRSIFGIPIGKKKEQAARS